MKSIYNSLLNHLQDQLPEIKWIDEDRDQLMAQRPAVAFPCCLIDIGYPSCKSRTDTKQHVKVAIRLRLAWDIKADTSANAPESIREDGLSCYGLIDDLHKAMQGWTPTDCDPLDRTSQKKATTKAAFTYDINYETVKEE